jgi:predicted DCC family thiol-disulfide oxidoreductase YuxK
VTVSEPIQGDILFYDGHCGLCHGAVLFVLNRRPRAEDLRFAPLQGETFASLISPQERETLPDSLVLRTAEGRLLLRSAGALYIGRRLGGIWRVLAALAWVVPRPLRDAVYGGIARYRKRWFGTRDATCPLVPPELRARFLP